ncbi:hypothetical protein HDU93_005273 [Gonapodya sp. JEL0774]|nr:hypothetical protein HDU93_005273 [Gonapodya sp. JEL0774]
MPPPTDTFPGQLKLPTPPVSMDPPAKLHNPFLSSSPPLSEPPDATSSFLFSVDALGGVNGRRLLGLTKGVSVPPDGDSYFDRTPLIRPISPIFGASSTETENCHTLPVVNSILARRSSVSQQCAPIPSSPNALISISSLAPSSSSSSSTYLNLASASSPSHSFVHKSSSLLSPSPSSSFVLTSEPLAPFGTTSAHPPLTWQPENQLVSVTCATYDVHNRESLHQVVSTSSQSVGSVPPPLTPPPKFLNYGQSPPNLPTFETLSGPVSPPAEAPSCVESPGSLSGASNALLHENAAVNSQNFRASVEAPVLADLLDKLGRGSTSLKASPPDSETSDSTVFACDHNSPILASTPPSLTPVSHSRTSPDDFISVEDLNFRTNVVPRPALRTPTPGRSPSPKSVRFSPSLTHTRHFFHTEAPLDVSNPLQTRYSLRATIPISWGAVVRLEGLRLPNSKSARLEGSIVVCNLAFQKRVTVRYTCDSWVSYLEAVGSYVGKWTGMGGGDEVFGFDVDLDGSWPPGSDSLDLQLVVKYEVGGAEYWDNNCGRNYEVTVVRRVVEDVTFEACAAADVRDYSEGSGSASWENGERQDTKPSHLLEYLGRPSPPRKRNRRHQSSTRSSLMMSDEETDTSDSDAEDDYFGQAEQLAAAVGDHANLSLLDAPRTIDDGKGMSGHKQGRRASMHPHGVVNGRIALHHPRPVSPTHPVPDFEVKVNGSSEYLTSFGLVAPSPASASGSSSPKLADKPVSPVPSKAGAIEDSPFFGAWSHDATASVTGIEPYPIAPVSLPITKKKIGVVVPRPAPAAPGSTQYTTSTGYRLSLSWAPDPTYMYSGMRMTTSMTTQGDPLGNSGSRPISPGNRPGVIGGSQRYGSPYSSGLYASDVSWA